jgi:hypothetical protein
MVEPTLRFRVTTDPRIRLTGLLTESPAFAGFSYSEGETACLTGASQPKEESGKALGRANPGAVSANVRLLKEALAE